MPTEDMEDRIQLLEALFLFGRDFEIRRQRTITASDELLDDDDLVLVDTSSGAVTLTLGEASLSTRKRYTIKVINATNTTTVQRSGSDTIDGAAVTSFTLTVLDQAVELEPVPEDDKWYRIGVYP